MAREDRIWQWGSNILLMLLSLACIFPFLLLIISSLTDEQSIIQNGYSFFPQKFSFAAYDYIWQQSSLIFNAYGITIFVTVFGTASSLLITSMLAYPLSRPDLPGGKYVAFLLFFALLFNGGLAPTYIIYTQVFHFKNTLAALIIPGLLMNGFSVLMMRGFFKTTVPSSVLESASIDGAREFTIYRKIVLPLSLPILAVVGLLQGLMYWNDWFNGLIYLTDPKLYSLQTVMNQLMSNIQFLSNNSSVGSLASQSMQELPTEAFRMAIAVISIAPIMIAYPFLQKYFVKGLAFGAVKG
ncbi:MULTISPECIES: carbohydrate ABC transporter permease [Paenibacillus]|uniref:carbohydrate ABC transporter permease n=1 Tax=Paenibacillus TaxID=44249 RepID=UPI0003D2A3E2|nr:MULTISPECIES: carbohydrate ABC transporter permease [Paenibacillus]AIW40052.1 sugar ABC transporter permease [Paenibacillus polymyxa CR1]OMF70305.1 sugar ABC transporter permease [Paenibacillus peoriae]OMF81231.1 sugar ABC transporter permease [Paenibacillus peoriae]POR28580.1 carbohydrate ABC transporter permease [Paenibacillus polymyxa]